MSIPSHIIDQLNSQADLVSIIGKHTTLKRSGNEYKGCCPFHGEKTPSFYVNPRKNVYNCFGCGASGNAISFLKDYENLTFMEAVTELSKQTGIELPKEDNSAHTYVRRIPPVSVNNSVNTTVKAPPRPNSDADGMKATSTTDQPIAVSTAPTSLSNDATNSTQPHTEQVSPSSPLPSPSVAQLVTTSDPINYPDDYPPDHLPPDWLPITPPLKGSDYGFDASSHVQHQFDTTFASNNYADYGIYGAYDGTDTANDLLNRDPLNSNSLNKSFDGNSAYPHNSQHIFTGNNLNPTGNLYELLSAVQAFYTANLQQHSNAMAYFVRRGISPEMMQTFALGYAPSDWQHLAAAFPHDIEGLLLLGLIRTSEKGHQYDLLRDRVIFPLRDTQGRVVGFAGRALNDEVKPKYLNSSDSPVFRKQQVLYGYYESRQQRNQDWMVVEGYMDVIALYQVGIYGAVAPMGTALSEGQIAKLWQLNDTLTLCFDGDTAGQKAAWRALETSLPLLTDDKTLRFLTLPDHHDPDTFIKAHGADAMRAQMQAALPLSQYIFAYLSRQTDLTLVENQAKLMAQVRALTQKLPKGSSFRSLLNTDIYQRLGGRRYKSSKATDALLDFASELTISRQLQLCLLFDPNCLSRDPIDQLWHGAGLKAVTDTDAVDDGRYQIPKLPDWSAIGDPELSYMVQTLRWTLNHHALPEDNQQATHFVLAMLPAAQRQWLADHWQEFFLMAMSQGSDKVQTLMTDLLVQLLLQVFSRQLAQTTHVVVMGILNKRRQALLSWYQQWCKTHHA